MLITKAPKPKLYHRACQVRADGAVFALCNGGERPINLKRALWTNRNEAVTCKRCLRMIASATERLKNEGP
jgi:hypothetical protein